MFHMMLAAPVLAVFGAMGAAVVAVLGLLLGFGLPLTVLLGFFLLYGVVCLAGWAVSAVLRLLFGLFR